jgi:cytidylate kinase
MISTGSVERLTEAVARAQQHWRSRPKEEARLTVALAREAGAAGTSVAREVGARLGWPVYDNELVEHIAKEMGLRARLLESVDERTRSWMLEWAESFRFNSPDVVSEGGYVRHLAQTVLSLGARGECVIVGRGAAFLLPPERTLRVRLVGRLEDRVAFAARRLGVSEKEAARWVEDTDRHRQGFVRNHFNGDITDPKNYDLILNTSRWSAAECADFIADAVGRMKKHAARAPGERGV